MAKKYKKCRIFEKNLEDTFTRGDKYSNKFDISRPFIRIFAQVFIKPIQTR